MLSSELKESPSSPFPFAFVDIESGGASSSALQLILAAVINEDLLASASPPVRSTDGSGKERALDRTDGGTEEGDRIDDADSGQMVRACALTNSNPLHHPNLTKDGHWVIGTYLL